MLVCTTIGCGGKDNFEVDREAAEAVRASRPDVADLALENKKFLTRAVGYVAGQGVRQFVDVGSGLPTSPLRAPGASPFWLATHEAARAVEADAMVAYVDSDPVAVQHSQALLADGGKRVVAAQGDLSDPAAVLAHNEILGAGLDLSAGLRGLGVRAATSCRPTSRGGRWRRSPTPWRPART